MQKIFFNSLIVVVIFFTTPTKAQVDTDFSGGGAVRVGDSTSTCDGTTEGAIRFDADGADTLDYCNGSSWLSLLTSAVTLDNINGIDADDTGRNIAIDPERSVNFSGSNQGNTALGYGALASANGNTDYNTAVGIDALSSIGGGGVGSNVAIGRDAGKNITGGSGNLMVGSFAGDALVDGSSNIFIGSNTDAPTTSTSNHLNIGNTLYGDLSTDFIGIGTATPAVALDVHTGSINAAEICDENNANCLDLSAGIGGYGAGDTILAGDGSAAAPSYSFQSDTDLGFYYKSPGVLAFANASSEILNFSTNGLIIAGTDAPMLRSDGFIFNPDTNSGMVHTGTADVIALRTGGADRLTVDASGNIGIGSDTPTATLDVVGNMGITGNINMTNDQQLRWGASYVTAHGGDNNIRFHTNGSERMRLNNGNLGIGTDAPTSSLVIDQAAGVRALSFEANSDTRLPYGWRTGTGWQLIGDSNGSTRIDIDGDNNSSGESFRVSEHNGANTLLHVHSGGNTGVGTDSPSDKLHVQGGDVRISSDNASSLKLYSYRNSNNLARIFGYGARGTEASPLVLNTNDKILDVRGFAYNGAAFVDTVRIQFETDGAQAVGDQPSRIDFETTPAGSSTPLGRMTIDNAGFVGIGTTTPQSHLHIEHTDSTITNVSSDPSETLFITRDHSPGEPTNGSYGAILGFGNNRTHTKQTSAIAIKQTTLDPDQTGLAFFTSPDLTIQTNLTESMVLTHDGLLGIGTATPAVALDVHTGSINAAEICDENNANCLDLSAGVGGSGDFLADGSVPMTGAFEATTGSAGSPSITFNGDENNGFFQNGPDTIGVTHSGIHAANLNNTAWTIFRKVRADNGGEAEPDFAFNNDGDTGMFDPAANTLGFSTGGTERLRIDSSGNVGIGTDNPSHYFHLQQTNTSTLTGEEVGLFSDLTVNPVTGQAANAERIGIKGNIEVTGTSNKEKIVGMTGRVNNSGTGNITDIMGVEASAFSVGTGNISNIRGTSTTAYSWGGTVGWLGAYYAWTGLDTGTVTDQFGLYIDTRNGGGIVTNRYGIYLDAPDDTGGTVTNDFGIYQEGTENNYFAGSVGIGTATPSHILHITGQGRSTNSAWATTSDARLKNVVGDYPYSLAEIDQINTYLFRYKSDNPYSLPSDEDFMGTMAQELMQIMPEAVSEDSNGYYTVNTDPIFWALVNATKELNVKCSATEEDLKNIRGTSVQNKRDIASLQNETFEQNQRIQKLEKENKQLKDELQSIRELLRKNGIR